MGVRTGSDAARWNARRRTGRIAYAHADLPRAAGVAVLVNSLGTAQNSGGDFCARDALLRCSGTPTVCTSRGTTVDVIGFSGTFGLATVTPGPGTRALLGTGLLALGAAAHGRRTS